MCKENKTRTAQLEAALKTLHEGLTQLRLVKYSNSADSWDAVKAKTQKYFDALEELRPEERARFNGPMGVFEDYGGCVDCNSTQSRM